MEIELTKSQKEDILKIFNLIEEDHSQFKSNIIKIIDHLLNEEIIDILDHDLEDRYDEYNELITDYLKSYLVQKDTPLECYQCGIEIKDVSLMTHIKNEGFIHSECIEEYEKDAEILLQQIKDGTWY